MALHDDVGVEGLRGFGGGVTGSYRAYDLEPPPPPQQRSRP